jgi:hypothetical protein
MTVQVYRSTDYGSPVLNNTSATIGIPFLDAFFLNGYGAQTPTSLTQVGGVATCTLPVAHGFPLNTSQNYFISGCNQTEYNGNQTITITSSVSFTFPINSGTVSPATGTIVGKVPGSGWTKPFGNTTAAVYRQGGGQQRYFKFDGTSIPSSSMRVFGSEVCTSLVDFASMFPTTTQLSGGVFLPTATLGTNVPWVVVADNKSINFWINVDGSAVATNARWCFFGDLIPTDPGDIYSGCCIGGNILSANTHALQSVFSTVDVGHYLVRRYGGLGGSKGFGKLAITHSSIGSFGSPSYPYIYPHGIDGKLHYVPIYAGDPLGLRGRIPGLYSHLHSATSFTHGDIFLGSGADAGKSFQILSSSSSTQLILETSNTWS